MKSKAKGIIASPRKQLVKSLQTEGIQRKPLQVFIKTLSAPRKGNSSIPGVETPSVPPKKRKYVSHSLPKVLCYKQHSLGSWSPPSATCAGHMSVGPFTVMVRGMDDYASTSMYGEWFQGTGMGDLYHPQLSYIYIFQQFSNIFVSCPFYKASSWAFHMVGKLAGLQPRSQSEIHIYVLTTLSFLTFLPRFWLLEIRCHTCWSWSKQWGRVWLPQKKIRGYYGI